MTSVYVYYTFVYIFVMWSFGLVVSVCNYFGCSFVTVQYIHYFISTFLHIYPLSMRKYLQFKKNKIKNVIWEQIRDSLDFGIFITYHLKIINPTNASLFGQILVKSGSPFHSHPTNGSK